MASKERNLHLAEFIVKGEDEDENYVAYGKDKDYMPVFRVRYGYHIEMKARYPSCLKFLHDVDVEETIKASRELIWNKYGEAVPLGEVPSAIVGASTQPPSPCVAP